MRLDLDGDKVVTIEEARAADRARARGENPIQKEPTPAPSERTLVRTVALMDTDGDGRLQKKEAPLALQKRLGSLDLNGDGAIDREEAVAGDRAGR